MKKNGEFYRANKEILKIYKVSNQLLIKLLKKSSKKNV